MKRKTLKTRKKSDEECVRKARNRGKAEREKRAEKAINALFDPFLDGE